jgi:hypothetical protein
MSRTNKELWKAARLRSMPTYEQFVENKAKPAVRFLNSKEWESPRSTPQVHDESKPRASARRSTALDTRSRESDREA